MYIKVQAPPSLAAREARNAPRGAKKTVYIYTLIYYTLYILYFYIHIYTDILLILYIIGTLSN